MSKHERQHSVTNNIVNTTISNESPIREVKRARFENLNPSTTTNWSTALYVNTQIKDENVKTNDEPQSGFSSCFLTDQLLMPDTKKTFAPPPDKIEYVLNLILMMCFFSLVLLFICSSLNSDTQNLRSLQSFRSNSSYSTEELSCIPCTHQNSLITLRSNVWTLLRMLLPQLSLYDSSISMIDDESDHFIDRLVANLIQIPSYYGSYPSV